jgi:hypothetical protein
MLIPARYLVDRLRQPRSRAAEALALRRRFASEPNASQVPAEEAAEARQLQALRLQLGAAISAVSACRSCAVGHPPPHGHFAGGHCCGLNTEDAFNDDEVAALHQAGTDWPALRLPVGDHAGCAFRGPTGCSLRTKDRPNLCVRYLCPDLTRELHQRGDLPAIEELCAKLEASYLRFITLRKERLEREEEARLVGSAR